MQWVTNFHCIAGISVTNLCNPRHGSYPRANETQFIKLILKIQGKVGQDLIGTSSVNIIAHFVELHLEFITERYCFISFCNSARPSLFIFFSFLTRFQR